MILDDNVGGSLQCDHNTPGVLTITTMNVTPNRMFNVRLYANNSRNFTAKADEIGKFGQPCT